MAYVVATIFDHPDEANESMRALERSGFDSGAMECIESDPEKQSFFKRVFTSDGGEELQAEKTMDFMTGMGIPEDEAKDYAKKVKKGHSLLLVNADSSAEAERVRDILARYPFEGTDGEKEEELGTTEEYIEGDLSAHPAGEEYHEGVGKERIETSDEIAEPEPTDVQAGEHEQDIEIQQEERVEASEEDLIVGKREEKAGGVRVEKVVSEESVEEDISLREEKVNVERRAVDRPLEEGEVAFEGDELEIPVTREEPVVHKEPRVREEVVITKESEEHPETVRETVRREDINIEQLTADERTAARFQQFEPDYRQHYDEHFADTGEPFDDYSTGYRYGMALAEDESYRDRDWESVEEEAGRQWESQQASSWDNFKEAVRFGWYKVRGEEEEYERRPPRA